MFEYPLLCVNSIYTTIQSMIGYFFETSKKSFFKIRYQFVLQGCMNSCISVLVWVGSALNRFKPTSKIYITDHSKAALLIWLSVFACFGGSFCTVFTFCVSR